MPCRKLPVRVARWLVQVIFVISHACSDQRLVSASDIVGSTLVLFNYNACDVATVVPELASLHAFVGGTQVLSMLLIRVK